MQQAGAHQVPSYAATVLSSRKVRASIVNPQCVDSRSASSGEAPNAVTRKPWSENALLSRPDPQPASSTLAREAAWRRTGREWATCGQPPCGRRVRQQTVDSTDCSHPSPGLALQRGSAPSVPSRRPSRSVRHGGRSDDSCTPCLRSGGAGGWRKRSAHSPSALTNPAISCVHPSADLNHFWRWGTMVWRSSRQPTRRP